MSVSTKSMSAMLGAASLLTATFASGDATGASRLPDLFGIGINSLGEKCVAQFDKKDPALAEPDLDQSYSLSCRSSVASRKVGTIRRVKNETDLVAAVEKTFECGAPQMVRLAQAGPARARRCLDKVLGSQTVVIDFVHRGIVHYGSGGIALVGPLEQGLAISSGQLAPSKASLEQIKPSFAVDKLMATSAIGGELTADEFNADNALLQGLRLNQQGLHIDASRQLNDAISRLPKDASSELRGQLELEAALADSNIGFFKSAAAHFERARDLLSASGNALIRRKVTSYEALHDINRRQFRSALAKLDSLATGRGTEGNPLRDPVILAGTNQAPRGTARAAGLGAVSAEDTSGLQQRVVDAVVDWARSAALLSLGETAEAERRVNDARRAFNVVKQSRIDVSQTLWLEARIERQAGRIAARQSKWADAIAAFDRALMVLRDAQQRNPGFGSTEIAAAQLERADLLARQGASRDVLIKEFGEGLETVAAAQTPGAIDPAAIERYLDILSNGTDGSADAESAERYFRAVQLVQDPGLARQIAQLQSVVSADPALAAQYQERTGVNKELIALRYEIGQKAGTDVTGLRGQQERLEKRLSELDDALASNAKFRSTDDKPATVAEIQASLRDGEQYFKFSTFRRGAYGIVISKQDAFIYRSPTSPTKLLGFSKQLRNSIVPDFASGKTTLPNYKVGLAYQLFNAVGGAATDRLAAARRLIVDPSGPLQTVPMGVLVVDRSSVDRYVAQTREKIQGYDKVAFLARNSEVSTSLSPRSFLVARNQPASRAARPFIGFGQHALPSPGALNSVSPYNTRTGCYVDGQTLDEAYSFPGLTPIDAEEMRIAAGALGDPSSPIITGEAFTDEGVIARKDLSQYGVLHFATHGFVEGVWLFCPKSPPSLLTSLGQGEDDGILSFDEIAGLELDANLVFLAACDTAVGIEDEELARASGQEEAGGSLEGLVRAFLTANARAVVATSWVAPNGETTLRLVRNFYETGRSSDVGAALHQGQLSLMNDAKASHPFRWASFFVVGDASKPLLSGTAAASLPLVSSAIGQ